MKNTNFKLKTKVLNRAVHTALLLLLAAGLLFTGCPQKAKPVYHTVSLVPEGGNLTANPEIQDGKVLKDSEITFTASPTNLSTHEVDKWEVTGGTKILGGEDGSICEWYWDWYSNTTPTGGQYLTGAASGSNSVGHGGSWDDDAGAAYRANGSPDISFNFLGFRAACRP